MKLRRLLLRIIILVELLQIKGKEDWLNKGHTNKKFFYESLKLRCYHIRVLRVVHKHNNALSGY